MKFLGDSLCELNMTIRQDLDIENVGMQAEHLLVSHYLVGLRVTTPAWLNFVRIGECVNSQA